MERNRIRGSPSTNCRQRHLLVGVKSTKCDAPPSRSLALSTLLLLMRGIQSRNTAKKVIAKQTLDGLEAAPCRNRHQGQGDAKKGWDVMSLLIWYIIFSSQCTHDHQVSFSVPGTRLVDWWQSPNTYELFAILISTTNQRTLPSS